MKDVRGVKAEELRTLGDCAKCAKKLLDADWNKGVFYVVSVEQALVDGNALRRAVGLEMQIGGLAEIMGPNEDLAKAIFPTKFMVHSSCALDHCPDADARVRTRTRQT